MSTKIVNLLDAVVAKTIEDVLCNYPDHPYQQAFAIPEMRQELIAYVLSETNGCYIVQDNTSAAGDDVEPPAPASVDQRAIVEQIHAGIHTILDRHGDIISHNLPETDDPGAAPSHWFG